MENPKKKTEEFKISLNHEQLNKLFVFLERTELKGSEVPIFVEIRNKLVAAVESPIQ